MSRGEVQSIVLLFHLSSNTWYMQDALDERRAQGQDVNYQAKLAVFIELS